MSDTLREMVEREMRANFITLDDSVEVMAVDDAVEVALRLLSEQQETVNALEITQDESDECAAELFGLVCAVVDGKPEAADARDRLQKHIEHVRACRKGSCDTELHGSKLRRERDEAMKQCCYRYFKCPTHGWPSTQPGGEEGKRG